MADVEKFDRAAAAEAALGGHAPVFHGSKVRLARAPPGHAAVRPADGCQARSHTAARLALHRTTPGTLTHSATTRMPPGACAWIARTARGV